MRMFRKTFAFFVLMMLLVASLILSSCNRDENEQQKPVTDDKVQAEQLVEQAKVELRTAEAFYKSGTCDSQRLATETLLKVDMINEQLTHLDADTGSKNAARNLAKLADDKYHQYIREGYAAECCWAMNLIIRCAENHLDQLEEKERCGLNGVKQFYARKCMSSEAPIQTAMLTL